jgi:choice-of-anchor C domain-containing protein
MILSIIILNLTIGGEMKKLIVIFTGFLFIFGLSAVSMAAPFQNGSFEDRIPLEDIDPFITLNDGDSSITGWTVERVSAEEPGSIDLIGSYWEASDGDRSIDLNGDGPGAISQDFDTEPGAVYHVLFDMAGNPDNPALKVLLISANSEEAEYEFDQTGLPEGSMGWTEMSFVFRASSASTTLKFASSSPPGASGPALDNVRVIPPFPADTMHPTGAVHAYPNLLWPPNNKKVKVKIQGYVFDELSTARDGDGIGVSYVYLLINGKMKVLRDDETDLLDSDGSFKIKVPLKAIKDAKYRIQLFATDTAIEEDGGPNWGLVDETKVIVPHDMSGKDKDKKKKKPKKKKKK